MTVDGKRWRQLSSVDDLLEAVPIVTYSFLTNRAVLSNSVTAAGEPARLTDHWSECVTAKELAGLATFSSRGRGAGRHVYSSWPTL